MNSLKVYVWPISKSTPRAGEPGQVSNRTIHKVTAPKSKATCEGIIPVDFCKEY